MRRVRTRWRITSPKLHSEIRLAVAADLHSGPYTDVLEDFAACDAVLIPGDLVNRHYGDNALAYRFLEEVPKRFPVYYALGNHERKLEAREAWMKAVSQSAIHLLDNDSAVFRSVRIAGLSSVPHTETPDTAFLDRLEQAPEFTLLMCHHPEMYRDYVRGRALDLTVCGHAHGGQIQLFGQGVFAPGQGFFPKLTHGAHDDGRMIVSRGMTNNVRMPIPRINNPCELLLLRLTPGKTYSCIREETR